MRSINEVKNNQLNSKEEIELIKVIQRGKGSTDEYMVDAAKKAAEKLILSNLGLVKKVANKYINYGLEFDDLVGEGCMGIVTAAKKFDINLGNRYSTYAVYWIKSYILRAISEQNRAVIISAYALRQINKIKNAKKKLSDLLGRTPSIAELSKETGIAVTKIDKYLLMSENVLSLDENVGEEDGETRYALIADENSKSPEEVFFQNIDNTEVINKIWNLLNEREQEILRMRTGFCGKTLSLEEIGKKYGLSRERVRQIEQKALNKIRSNCSVMKELEYVREAS